MSGVSTASSSACPSSTGIPRFARWSPEEGAMNAADIMTTKLVTITPDASLRDAVWLILTQRISALPVVDATGRLVGIVSEGDLLRRAEVGTERRRSWWSEFNAGN